MVGAHSRWVRLHRRRQRHPTSAKMQRNAVSPRQCLCRAVSSVDHFPQRRHDGSRRHWLGQEAVGASAARLRRGPYMMTATPARQTDAPVAT
jgi:hypothetical protein